jgi:hypothetical protein
VRKVIRIDENGMFVEDVLIGDHEPIPDDCVETEVPEGFYHPRWDGAQWVEGLTQEEIDQIRNAPKPESPEQRISALEEENAFLALELATAQARLDQTEQEQAALLLELVSREVI